MNDDASARWQTSKALGGQDTTALGRPMVIYGREQVKIRQWERLIEHISPLGADALPYAILLNKCLCDGQGLGIPIENHGLQMWPMQGRANGMRP